MVGLHLFHVIEGTKKPVILVYKADAIGNIDLIQLFAARVVE
ncbi:hypothetical protein [Pseudohalioglobus lutimaris]|nr:hypothetical protein [Pseudohalioglobus lutimaris]